ncbi:MAG: hypothetical protein GXP63_05715 [DPANN group archaeon]|nr:hypothetical protein [DPANN group archaeon]
MKCLHNVIITVFEKDKDREEQVIKTLHDLIPFDWKQEKIQLKQENAKGIEGDHISIFRVRLEKQRHLRTGVDHLKDRLGPAQVNRLNKEKVSRLDGTLHFYLRLDKKELEDGNYVLTDSGDCYHIRMSIAAYPKSMSAGLRVIDGLFPGQKA